MPFKFSIDIKHEKVNLILDTVFHPAMNYLHGKIADGLDFALEKLSENNLLPEGAVTLTGNEVVDFVTTSAVDYFMSLILLLLAVAVTLFHYRHTLLFLYLIKNAGKIRRFIVIHGLFGSVIEAFRLIAAAVMTRFQRLPFVKAKIDTEVNKVLAKVEKSLIKRETTTFQTKLPERGWSNAEIIKALDENTEGRETKWEDGKVSGAVYNAEQDILDVQVQAYKKYAVANQLHPDVFPGVRKMESEVVEMVLNLYNAPEGACGTTTSGGTESLLLTCLAAREKAYKERGITEPEILAPTTIHAAFDKAAYYFKMKLIHVPLDPKTYQVDLNAVKKLINKNTVLIAGSAPNFPHGIIDDIQGLSKLALKHNIPLHVDACLGSFIVPFLEEAGVDVPPFDFRVPGVTSISCDTHKYGFAPKGSSIIMYRNNALRNYQYFVDPKWTGGLYASPTLAGSRPGALMVGCWASLMAIGHAGYLKSCKEIVGAGARLKKAIIEEIPALYVIGDPKGSVVSFSSDIINIYDLSDNLTKKGWHLCALQRPAAIHIAITRLSLPVIDQLVADLKTVTADLLKNGHGPTSGDTAALYGVAGSIQTVGVADRIAAGFLDCLYKV